MVTFLALPLATVAYGVVAEKELIPMNEWLYIPSVYEPTTKSARALTGSYADWPYPGNPYMENGKIHWYVISKKATSNITYHTVGWTIHKQPTVNGDIERDGQPYGVMMGEQINEVDIGGGLVFTEFECNVEEVTDALSQARRAY